MASCGFSEQAHRGAICPSAMGLGKRYQVGSIAGGVVIYGIRFSSRCSQLADADGKLNWEVHHVDGSVIRAHQHAAGALMGDLDPASELSAIEQVQARVALLTLLQAAIGTKIHLRCDGNGLPITFLLTVGERHEAVVFELLLEQGTERANRGRASTKSDLIELWVTKATAVVRFVVICGDATFV